jgi:hypothetical protein
MNTIETVSEVVNYAKCPFKDTRVIDAINVGQWIRQGDVYLERIGSPSDWAETPNRQLAIGTTNGSRHTVFDNVTVLKNPENGVVKKTSTGAVCMGPQVVSKERFTVSHPEHADFSLPAGCYQVRFQVDARSYQRVQD